MLCVELWLELVDLQHFFYHEFEVVISSVNDLDVLGVYLMSWILFFVWLYGWILFRVVVFLDAVLEYSLSFTDVKLVASFASDFVYDQWFKSLIPYVINYNNSYNCSKKNKDCILKNQDIVDVINFCIYISSIEYSKITKCKSFSNEVYGEADLGSFGCILDNL